MPSTHPRSVLNRRWLILSLLVIWSAGVVLSMRYLLHYEKTPGETRNAPAKWPAAIPDTGEADAPTLVVALHPRCSCSRASITELEASVRSFNSPFNALMLVYQPAQGDSTWQSTALFQDARQALNASMVPDIDGRLAARFGARTSGEVLLYSARDRSGTRRLLYAGGVTGARGMPGANEGAAALVRAFHLRQTQPGRPVFGCGIFSLAPSNATANTGNLR